MSLSVPRILSITRITPPLHPAQPSQAIIGKIKEFEGFSAKTYICPAGELTIGYGHTGKEAYPGNVITEDRATWLLTLEAIKFGNEIKKLVNVRLSQFQFDSLVSWVYNLGSANLKHSTLLKVLNKKRYELVPEQIRRWVFADGVVLPGLVTRRNYEARLFETGTY